MILLILSLFALIFSAIWIFLIMPSPKAKIEKRTTAGTATQNREMSCKLKKLSGFSYAHRGLHNKKIGIPENSLVAFNAAVREGFGIELDIRLTKDGETVVMHDPSLLRTAGTDKAVISLTSEELNNFTLEGTKEKIPFFSQVLETVSGKVPLLIELKNDENNAAALCERTMELLSGYNGDYCVESFDPRVLSYLRKHHPQVIRGQLSGYLRRGGENLNIFLDFGLRNLLSNVFTRPHFISYKFKDRKNISLWICKRIFGATEFGWTIKTKEKYIKAKRKNVIPIFEGFIPKGTDKCS